MLKNNKTVKTKASTNEIINLYRVSFVLAKRIGTNNNTYPIKTPIQQYVPPKRGPYIRLPTIHITDAGIGKNTTWKSCMQMYVITPFSLVDRIYSFNDKKRS